MAEDSSPVNRHHLAGLLNSGSGPMPEFPMQQAWVDQRKSIANKQPGDAEAGPRITLVTSSPGHTLTESREVPVGVINVCVLSHVQPLETLWTVCHAPLSVGFPRKEYWLPCPPPRDLPDPGIEPESLTSPELAGSFFTTSATWEAQWEASISPLKYALCASFGAEDGVRAMVRVRAHRVAMHLCCCP